MEILRSLYNSLEETDRDNLGGLEQASMFAIFSVKIDGLGNFDTLMAFWHVKSCSSGYQVSHICTLRKASQGETVFVENIIQ